MTMFRDTEFTVTEDHLKLLHASIVGWDSMEFGAAAIDPKRPYGNSDVIADIARILGEGELDEDDDVSEVWFDANEERLIRLHRETQTALQIALVTGGFVAGTYTRPSPYGCAWELAPWPCHP